MNDERQRKAIKNYYERNSQINRDLRKKIRNAYGKDFDFVSTLNSHQFQLESIHGVRFH